MGRQVVNKLKPDFLLIDGNFNIDTDIPQISLIKGDSESPSIAAASIIAKVYRDNLMELLHYDYPYYNWKKNKGYGTKEHINAIKQYGVTKYHRKTFLKKILGEN